MESPFAALLLLHLLAISESRLFFECLGVCAITRSVYHFSVGTRIFASACDANSTRLDTGLISQVIRLTGLRLAFAATRQPKTESDIDAQ